MDLLTHLSLFILVIGGILAILVNLDRSSEILQRRWLQIRQRQLQWKQRKTQKKLIKAQQFIEQHTQNSNR